MRLIKQVGILIAMTVVLLGRPPVWALDQNSLHLINASVVDVISGYVLPGMNLTVRGDRIESISQDFPLAFKNSEFVDATGKFVIPGLFDMHAHFLTEENYLLTYAANGVTFVRGMGSIVIRPGGPDGFTYLTRQEMIDAVLETRRKLTTGELLGPEIVTPGIILTGPLPDGTPFDPPTFHWVLTTAEGTRAITESLYDQKVDFFKVHTMPSREVYFTVAAQADRLGLPFAGHVPLSVSAVEAVEAGQASIEHQTGVAEYMALAGDDPAAAEDRRAELFRIYAAHPQTWHTPTLVVALGLDQGRRIYSQPESEPHQAYISPSLFAWWKKYWPPEMFAGSENEGGLEELIGWVGEMNELGIKIMAGSDLAALGVYPGFSLHEELILLNRAGLTPLEVLRTATINPARFLGLENSRGSIAPGKTADLVILEGNPLDLISNTRKIAGVVLRGRYLSRSRLDDILLDVRLSLASDQ